MVSESWQEGLRKFGGSPSTNCIDRCRARLLVWNKVEFGHVGRKIARLQLKLRQLELLPTIGAIEEELQEVRKSLNI